MKSYHDIIPLLDDWADGIPDSWDYELVLKENNVVVEPCKPSSTGEWSTWCLSWEHGAIQIGKMERVIALKAAALFVSLWLRAVSASFAVKLMQGYILFLEIQNES